MAAGGGGSSGAGKETAGATTLSDLNNFQFQEGKRELEKYRRCDLAAGREEAPKGSRVCGGASLDAAKKAREHELGGGGGTVCGEEPLRRAALAGRDGALPLGSAEAEGPAGARPSDPHLRVRLVPGAPVRTSPALRGERLRSRLLDPQRRRATTGPGQLAARPLGGSLKGFWQRTPQFSRAPPLLLFSLSSFQ